MTRSNDIKRLAMRMVKVEKRPLVEVCKLLNIGIIGTKVRKVPQDDVKLGIIEEEKYSVVKPL